MCLAAVCVFIRDKCRQRFRTASELQQFTVNDLLFTLNQRLACAWALMEKKMTSGWPESCKQVALAPLVEL